MIEEVELAKNEESEAKDTKFDATKAEDKKAKEVQFRKPKVREIKV